MAIDITRLSANALAARIMRLEAKHAAARNACIDAGLGLWKHSALVEAATRTDDIGKVCAAYLETWTPLYALYEEQRARRRWHGSDKPIKKPSV